MKFGVVTLFPSMVEEALKHGVVGNGFNAGLLKLTTYNPRDYGEGNHHSVDDKPYGGGAGMVMTVNPLRKAIKVARCEHREARVIYLCPQGEVLNQKLCNEFSSSKELILLAGRYEGIDHRVIELDVDKEISIGDYVLSGGEPAVIVLIDAISRLCSGVLGNPKAIKSDSHSDKLLEGPQFTRPREIDGLSVPEVLLSGDHKAIEKWRRKQALGLTVTRRLDLMQGLELSFDDRELLKQYKREIKS